MKSILFSLFVFFMIGVLNAQNNWPQWRGPNADGLLPGGNPPIEFGEDKNIKWKIELPGAGNSTPVIWQNQLFILTAIPTDETVDFEREDNRGLFTDKVQEFVVLSIDKSTGKIVWRTTVNREFPPDNTHPLGSWASNSPMTDGKNIYAYFGSRGLYCLDMKGNVLWERDFGTMDKVRSFGEGSSPLVYDGKVYVVWDHEGDSFIYALDAKTGKDAWVRPRDEGSSWGTPFVTNVNGKTQLIVSATNRIRAYDPDNGDVIWQCGGLTRNVIPQPHVYKNIILFASGFRGAKLLAIDLNKAVGDITDTDAVVWSHDEETPYTPSPLLIENLFYMLRGNNASLTCLDAQTGKVHYTKLKLQGGGNVYASLAGVKDRFYVTCENGNFFVVKHGATFELLAQNKLDDEFIASPAIIGDEMFVRGRKYLYCISGK